MIVYDSIRVAANLPPIVHGRFSLMLQERWEGSVLANIVAFFVAIGMSDRCAGVEYARHEDDENQPTRASDSEL